MGYSISRYQLAIVRVDEMRDLHRQHQLPVEGGVSGGGVGSVGAEVLPGVLRRRLGQDAVDGLPLCKALKQRLLACVLTKRDH